jgi:hypothetical protein
LKALSYIQTHKKWIARISITSILVIGILWIIYQPKDPIESLVPEHASWYIEIEKPLDVLKGTQKGLRFFSDPNLTVFAEWQKQLEFVRQLLGKEPQINQFIQKSTLGISSHILSGKESGYIFYIALPSSKHEGLYEMLRKFYKGKSGFFFQEREYVGKKICEITFKENNLSFSVSGSDEALVGSFSGFLVEEVVRKSGLIFKPNFVSKLRKDSRFSVLASKPVRLFVNLPRIPEYFFQYLQPNMKGLNLARAQGRGMALGFDAPSGLEWKTEGFLLQEDPKEKHQHENELDLNMLSFVPQNQALVFQYGLSDLWQSLPDRKWNNPDPAQDTLPQALENELLLCLAEGEGLKKYNKLLVAKIKNEARLGQLLQAWAEKPGGEKPYEELSGDIVIKQITQAKFGKWVGGSLMEDWFPLFYAKKENHLLVSDDLDLLKKSLLERKEKLAQAATVQNPAWFRFQFMVHKSIPLLMESAQGIFKTNFSDWVPLLKSINSLNIQDHGERENPSFTLEIKWTLPSNLLENWKTIKETTLDTSLASGFVRVESSQSNQTHWIVQDKRMRGILLGNGLEKKFEMILGSWWASPPKVLEGRNKKGFSIALATKGALHVVDAFGNETKPFPLYLPDTLLTIENFNVVDYDGSRNYRFFIGSRYGDVFTTDLSGNFLEGWNPRRNENPLSQAPRHVRIGDKDLVAMLDNMGNLLICNRKGEVQAGFPVKLGSRSTQPIFIENGLSLKNSFVYVLSEIGEIEKVNFLGERSSRIQLFRPEKDTRFQFLIDQRLKTFCVARISGSLISIFDQSYRQIMEFKASTDQIFVQHFHFGASNKIFAISDKGSQKCYLLDETGLVMSPEPIDSEVPLDIISKPNAESGFWLIKAKGKTVSLIEFKKE